MDRNKITEAITKARKGIVQYLEIMDLFHKTDVSTDRQFQRKYNSFYRVRQRTEEWYHDYYSFMEDQKGKNPQFSIVLWHLYSELKRYEPSFSSKFVATHNPNLPIWDTFVLKNVGIKAPYYSDRKKLLKAEGKYNEIVGWYARYIGSDYGKLIINIFDELVTDHNRISDLKKIDFVVWQIRAKPYRIETGPDKVGLYQLFKKPGLGISPI
jgi:hypothetical protein